MYKAIGFDMGGVIIHYSIPEQIREIAEYFKVEPSLVSDSMHKLRPLIDVGDIDNAEFWARLLKEIGIDADPESTRHLWNDAYIKKNPFIEGMVELVETLKSKGYKLGLLSNIDPDHAKINYSRHIFEHFDVALLSDEIRARKPMPEAYQLLCDKLGVDPQELIFVDDLQENVEGANRFGATGILFVGKEDLVARLRKLNVKI